MCTQRRLRSAWASAQSDHTSLCTQWVAKDKSFLHAHSENSDQTGQMSTLIRVFAGCTGNFVGFVMLRLISNSYIIKHHTSQILFSKNKSVVIKSQFDPHFEMWDFNLQLYLHKLKVTVNQTFLAHLSRRLTM